MRRSFKRVSAFLSILLMGCLPLLAATLGYECRCTGRAVLVAVDRGHGPHGEWCLLEGAAAARGQEDGGPGAPVQGDHTEHHAAVQNHTGGLVPTIQAAPAVTLAALPYHRAWGSRWSRAQPGVVPRGLSSRRPPPALGMPRTVVLLI